MSTFLGASLFTFVVLCDVIKSLSPVVTLRFTSVFVLLRATRHRTTPALIVITTTTNPHFYCTQVLAYTATNTYTISFAFR
jgi:hypothetical protein